MVNDKKGSLSLTTYHISYLAHPMSACTFTILNSLPKKAAKVMITLAAKQYGFKPQEKTVYYALGQ